MFCYSAFVHSQFAVLQQQVHDLAIELFGGLAETARQQLDHVLPDGHDPQVHHAAHVIVQGQPHGVGAVGRLLTGGFYLTLAALDIFVQQEGYTGNFRLNLFPSAGGRWLLCKSFDDTVWQSLVVPEIPDIWPFWEVCDRSGPKLSTEEEFHTISFIGKVTWMVP